MLEEIGGFEGNDLSPRGGNISSAGLEQLRAFLQPRAELELGGKLRKSGVRCAIDISDGLISEAAHLSIESGVSVTLDISESLFYDSVKDRPLSASASGEDFILMFGASSGLDFTAEGCSLIGRAEPGKSEVKVNVNGETVNIEKMGYDHLEV
jgi:thiamine-monophosphate kinase